jgi:uncharacterized protein (TIGR00730 family)
LLGRQSGFRETFGNPLNVLFPLERLPAEMLIEGVFWIDLLKFLPDSIGYNIGLPREQEPNAYSTPDLTFQFHYFAVRKLHFAMRANALVAFPGGFGTLDELFELLTLIQTQKMPAVPIVLIDRSYWSRVINFESLAEEGMIDRTNLDLFSYADNAEDAWRELVRRGLKAGPRSPGYPSTFDLRE